MTFWQAMGTIWIVILIGVCLWMYSNWRNYEPDEEDEHGRM